MGTSQSTMCFNVYQICVYRICVIQRELHVPLAHVGLSCETIDCTSNHITYFLNYSGNYPAMPGGPWFLCRDPLINSQVTLLPSGSLTILRHFLGTLFGAVNRQRRCAMSSVEGIWHNRFLRISFVCGGAKSSFLSRQKTTMANKGPTKPVKVNITKL